MIFIGFPAPDAPPTLWISFYPKVGVYCHRERYPVYHVGQRYNRNLAVNLIPVVENMSTRAILALNSAGVPFEVITYAHRKKGAAFAAQAMGFPLEKTVKTLIANLGGPRYAVALLPGNIQLDLKKLAGIFGVKHASMADTVTAERLSGYLVSGISPFGLKQPLESVMDSAIMPHQTVAINGGKRGLMLKMAPGDIRAALGCRVADIGRQA